MIVIRCTGLVGASRTVGGAVFNPEGLYLKYYDPEYAGGVGIAGWDPLNKETIVFPTMADALEFAQQVSKTRPTRWDGQPNRPLTAYTLEFLTLEAAQAEALNASES